MIFFPCIKTRLHHLSAWSHDHKAVFATGRYQFSYQIIRLRSPHPVQTMMSYSLNQKQEGEPNLLIIILQINGTTTNDSTGFQQIQSSSFTECSFMHPLTWCVCSQTWLAVHSPELSTICCSFGQWRTTFVSLHAWSCALLIWKISTTYSRE